MILRSEPHGRPTLPMLSPQDTHNHWHVRLLHMVMWFGRMIDEQTNRFFYICNPVAATFTHQGHRPIRELATCWTACVAAQTCQKIGLSVPGTLQNRLNSCVSATLAR